MDALGERFPAVLAAAVDGDPTAFAELWRATHPQLLRYLRVLTGADAEDVASETWLKVMRSLASFSGDEGAFRAWLTVIARNHARDVARKAARRPEVLTDEAPTTPDGAAPDAAELALERLGTEQALRLLATLPAPQAEMVALRVVVGLEPTEIAAIVERSPGAVRRVRAQGARDPRRTPRRTRPQGGGPHRHRPAAARSTSAGRNAERSNDVDAAPWLTRRTPPPPRL